MKMNNAATEKIFQQIMKARGADGFTLEGPADLSTCAAHDAAKVLARNWADALWEGCLSIESLVTDVDDVMGLLQRWKAAVLFTMKSPITIHAAGYIFSIHLNGKGGTITSTLSGDRFEGKENSAWDRAVDVIESGVLAHACAGVDVTSAEYVAGLTAWIESCANHL